MLLFIASADAEIAFVNYCVDYCIKDTDISAQAVFMTTTAIYREFKAEKGGRANGTVRLTICSVIAE